ncbi:MAG: DUF1549 domain-containing protein [Pirellulales bacterium]
MTYPAPSRSRRSTQWHSICGCVALVALLFAGPTGAAEPEGSPPSADPPVSYSRQIRPIFQAQCQGCHQPAKAEGGYVMTDFPKLLAGGESQSAAIVPSRPDESRLLALITPVDGQAEMPKKGSPLNEDQIGLIRRWISQGATDDTPASTQPAYDADHPPKYGRAPVITSLDFSPDGQLLAVSGFHEVLLHRADGSGLAARLIGMSERIESVKFSPDGSRLAVAAGSPARMGEVQIWDVPAKSLTLSLPITFDTVYGVSWSPDQKLVAFGCADNSVRAIDAETGKQVLFQGSHNDWVFDTTFSADGKHLVSVGRDMTAKLIEVGTERFVDNITSITPGALKGGITSVVRHPLRDAILFGGADGVPKIYQMHRTTTRQIGDDANLLWELPGLPGRVFSVDYSRDATRIAAGSSLNGKGMIKIFGIAAELEIPENIRGILVKPTHARSAEENQALKQHFANGVKTIAEIPVDCGIYAVAFSPDGTRLAAGGGDGKIRVIDTANGSIVSEFMPVEIQPQSEQSSVETSAAAAETVAAIAPAAPAELPQISRLRVEPATIQLDSAGDYAQLVVTADLPDGATIDATRWVEYSGADPVVAISPTGKVTPRAAGQAQLTATWNGQQISVPVTVGQLSGGIHPDYVRDVMPVISRMGCNAGTCHGSKDGKNGFKLSLRGYDPIYDVRAFTDDLGSRRVNLASPDQSLMLLKATASVPHQGGQLTQPDSSYYRLLRAWIADGAQLDLSTPRVKSLTVTPVNPAIQQIGSFQQLRVVATYADGRQRDVTSEAFLDSGNTEVLKAVPGAGGLFESLRRGEAPVLVRYEGAYAATTVTVMGDRSGFVWADQPANNPIDVAVAAKWKRNKILPSELCDDYEFIRRIYLDLTGLPPTSEQVRQFVGDSRPAQLKRDELIDKLVGSPEYVEHWASKWADLLQVNGKFLGPEGAASFREWIRSEIARNTPYDEFARKILTASGSNRENPAASYYKILRSPDEMMENTTHLFLATRFNCNKCHDHPFERWTQDQYYQLSAYFAQVGLETDPASGDRRIGGTDVEAPKPLYEMVVDRSEGEVKHERTGAIAPPAVPFPASYNSASEVPRRQQLAGWITSSDNAYFAKSYVNRLWGYLLGTGIIEPIDDIRAGNPPTNPELLQWLTDEFIRSGFDVQHMVRTICKSRTYQLSIASNAWNEDDSINFSHAKARRLPAEVLYDAIQSVTGSHSHFPGLAEGTRAAALPDVGIKLPDGFLGNLGQPPRESACECERSNDLQLGPVMALVSGATVGEAIGNERNGISQLVESMADDRALFQELFMRILNRPASEVELQAALDLMTGIDVDHRALQEQLAAAERDWSPIEADLQRQRDERIEKAKAELESYRADHQPQWDQLQRERDERIAAAQTALDQYLANLPEQLRTWESAGAVGTEWVVLDPLQLVATGGTKLEKQPDLSVLATGDIGRGNYEFTVESYLPQITGVRIEALADERLPKSGPGRSGDGNFVLSEFQVQSADLSTSPETEVAAWDFAQAAHDWQSKGDVQAEWRNGVLNVTSSGADPQLIHPVTASGSLFAVEWQAKVDGVADGRLYWTTAAAGEFAEERSVPVAMSGQGRWLKYRAYFVSGGDLTGLRWDPDTKAGSMQVRAVRLWRVDSSPLQDVGLANAQADFSQDGYAVATAIDGQAPDASNGWAVSPQAGQSHVATFELKEPLKPGLGALLKFTLQQNFTSGQHALGRFRLAVTSSPTPLDPGQPEAVRAVLGVAADARTDAQRETLKAYFLQHSRPYQELQKALAEAQRPIPPDERFEQLKGALAQAETPVTIDPDVLRLRQRVATSEQQLQHKRLTAAQDLAWALINSPAFLFNH